MEQDLPYRLVRSVGRSPVCTVWSAHDTQGRPVTVVILDAAAALDERWWEAFRAAADSPVQPHSDTSAFIEADFSAAAPWVAYRGEHAPGAERILRQLGHEHWPASPDLASSDLAPPAIAHPGPGAQIWNGEPAPQPGIPAPPVAPWLPVSAPPRPISAPRPQVSGAPAPYGYEWSSGPGAQPAQPVSPSSPPQDPFTSPGRRIQPVGRPRRRVGLWVGVAAAVVGLIAGAGALVVVFTRTDHEPAPRSASSASVEVSAPAPHQPGIEPPRPGDWPNWPHFDDQDKVRKAELSGLDFVLTLPDRWTCARAGTGGATITYRCGVSLTDGTQVGGEVTVRGCPVPCDAMRRDEMRKVEEAWGAQWRIAGPYAYLVETLKLENGTRYGIVVVGYFRSTPEDPVNRQVVVRMTAPKDWMDDLRKVVNGVHDVTAV